MGRLSTAVCFILALLTVLSIAPVILLVFACAFSSSCLAYEFTHFLAGPGGVRPVSVAILLAPLLLLLTYVFTFLRCHRRRDVIELGDRTLG